MPDASETLTVYDVAPARLGVPLMRQSRSSASPCGRAPPVNTQEYGGTPPLTAQVLEYGTPTSTPDTGQRPENGDLFGVTGTGGAIGPKLAVTATAALPATEQGCVPEHPPPLQPRNVDEGPGLADRTTAVPDGKTAEHAEPQRMPDGALATVPVPLPALATRTFSRSPAPATAHTSSVYGDTPSWS